MVRSELQWNIHRVEYQGTSVTTNNKRKITLRNKIITNDDSDVSLNGNDSKDFPDLIMADILGDDGSEEAVSQSAAGAEEGGDEDHGEAAAEAEADQPCHEGEKAEDTNHRVSGVKNTARGKI